MQFVLIGILGAVYPLLHLFNAAAFQFAEISPHIGLVYLPAFLRLFNVLVLGPRDGTLATLLGDVLLMRYFNDSTLLGLLNVLCSVGGPLVALALFKFFFKRAHELTSLRDLTLLTLMYAPANALLHHLMWSLLAPQELRQASQLLWMMVGDLLGALLGAYAMRFALRKYQLSRSPS